MDSFTIGYLVFSFIALAPLVYRAIYGPRNAQELYDLYE